MHFSWRRLPASPFRPTHKQSIALLPSTLKLGSDAHDVGDVVGDEVGDVVGANVGDDVGERVGA